MNKKRPRKIKSERQAFKPSRMICGAVVRRPFRGRLAYFIGRRLQSPPHTQANVHRYSNFYYFSLIYVRIIDPKIGLSSPTLDGCITLINWRSLQEGRNLSVKISSPKATRTPEGMGYPPCVGATQNDVMLHAVKHLGVALRSFASAQDDETSNKILRLLQPAKTAGFAMTIHLSMDWMKTM